MGQSFARAQARSRATPRTVDGSPWWTDTLNVAPGETYEIAFTADNPDRFLLPKEAWEEVLIVSEVEVAPGTPGTGEGVIIQFAPAPGAKCARCWRVLPEVGRSAAHPALCLRCEAVVEAQEREPAAA